MAHNITETKIMWQIAFIKDNMKKQRIKQILGGQKTPNPNPSYRGRQEVVPLSNNLELQEKLLKLYLENLEKPFPFDWDDLAAKFSPELSGSQVNRKIDKIRMKVNQKITPGEQTDYFEQLIKEHKDDWETVKSKFDAKFHANKS